MPRFGSRFKGIIFDMDNTLLRSRIDFPRMKREVFRLLQEQHVIPADFPLQEHTIATLLEWARGSEKLTIELERAVWELVAELEREGMQNAGLEPGVRELLAEIRNRFSLVVLTNNARQAAVDALQETGIIGFFDHIVGREQAGELKPSSSGIRHILQLYPALSAAHWLSVGDSWIDGKAAQDGGVAFIAYRGKEEEFARRGITPIANLVSIRELLRFLE